MQSWSLILYAVFLLLTVINYRWGLYISLGSITGYMLFPYFWGGPPLLWHEPLIPFVFVMFLYNKKKHMEPLYALTPRYNPLYYATGLFLLVIVGQYFRNPVLTSRLGGGGGFLLFYRFMIDFMLLVMVADESQTPQGRRRLLWATLVSALLTTLVGVLAYHTPAVYLFLDRLGFTRVKAWNITIDRVSGAVRFLMLQIPSYFGLHLLVFNPLRLKRWLRVPLLLFFGYTLILSGGRSVFWGSLVSLLVITLFRFRRQMLLVMTVLLTAGLTATVVTLAPDLVPPAYRRVFRIVGTEKEISAVRFNVHRLMMEQIAKNPVFGVGFKPDVFIAEFIPREVASEFVLKNLTGGGHGSFYSLMYFFGLVGLLPYLYAIWRALMILWDLLHNKDPAIGAEAALYAAWFLTTLAMYYAFYRGEAPQLFFLYGLITGLAIEQRLREEQETVVPSAATVPSAAR